MLISDFLVCIGFFFPRFGFLRRVLLFVPVHVRKRGARLKAATATPFFVCLRLCCKNPSIVIQCAAARTLHDDAPIHATSSHPTARRVEQRRRGSAGKVVPASAP